MTEHVLMTCAVRTPYGRTGVIVVVRADGSGGATLVWLIAVERGRSVRRAANRGFPDIAVTRANETMIRVAVAFVGRAV